jgi:hypothetical protein
MSFIAKFKIPYQESLDWDRTVGQSEIERLGLCGQFISTKKSKVKGTDKFTWQVRFDKLEQSGKLNFLERAFLEELEKDRFQDKVCILLKDHKGKCSNKPYLPKVPKHMRAKKSEEKSRIQKIIEGLFAKICDPENNPGGDPLPYQNRGGSRNNLTMVDKDTAKEIRALAKKSKKEKYFTNLAIRLSMGASSTMISLGILDMLVCSYHVKDAKEIFSKYSNITPEYIKILEQRWKELKDINLKAARPLVIFDKHNNLQSPINNKTIELEQFGKGHTDLTGIQFGHIQPVSELKWMTRPGNIIPLPRHCNLKQSNSSLNDVPIEQLNDALKTVARLKELGALTDEYKSIMKQFKYLID